MVVSCRGECGVVGNVLGEGEEVEEGEEENTNIKG